MTGVAIVTSSGGMTCAYSVGAILALKDHYGLTPETVDLAIGSSGSTGTLSYMASWQYECFRNIWEELITTSRFINYCRFHKVMDVDYLVDEVFGELDPLDIDAVKRSPMKLLIPVTHAVTGELRYFSNRDNVDHFELLRASKAAPIVYGRKVYLDGEPFIDSALSVSTELNIQRAVQEGARKIIVIDNTVNSWWSRAALYSWSLCVPRGLGRTIRNNCLKTRHTQNSNVRVIRISRNRNLPGSILDNNPDHIRETIDLGYDDVERNLELKRYL